MERLNCRQSREKAHTTDNFTGDDGDYKVSSFKRWYRRKTKRNATTTRNTLKKKDPEPPQCIIEARSIFYRDTNNEAGSF
nr:hypothetical protein [Tanacetum cinerariifolium]